VERAAPGCVVGWGVEIHPGGGEKSGVDEGHIGGCGSGQLAGGSDGLPRGSECNGSTPPDPAQVDVYRKAYALYRELYPALKTSFEKMRRSGKLQYPNSAK